MSEREFLDSNILVYSVDRNEPEKRSVAMELIRGHLENRTGVISTQVLQEFYSAATRKLHIPARTARQHVIDFGMFDVVQITPDMIQKGIDCSILHQISFWDGLIVSAASVAKAGVLLSEDLNDGQSIQGIKVHNPFFGI